ncbi:MAG TPA: hypothetical protein VK501_06920 [Baekduia sp.]|uniref:hypothetical protein n=1 Tax=Baekduia sp. TaxID=2600305 RepID=UPI002C127F65|nr:hypothetical protein [Baekduia sp.]HMJ33632.1 hypothetical protein [Baekduia sp.]
MTTKAAFNAEEWTAVTTAPVLTGMLVMAADRGGSVRESVGISRAYATARAGSPGDLLKEILVTPPTLDRATVPKDAEGLLTLASAKLRQAVRALDRLASDDEVVEYKRFVYALAETVARAHREGGFLGIGGTEISEQEQKALDAVAAIFDEPPATREEPAPEPAAEAPPEPEPEPAASDGESPPRP